MKTIAQIQKLSDGLAKGGQLACGGSALDGEDSFMEATVVVDVEPDNPLFDELLVNALRKQFSSMRRSL